MTKKLIAGPRGGYYWIDENDKKHYVKGNAKKVAKTKGVKKVKRVIEFISDMDLNTPTVVETPTEEIVTNRYSAKITKYNAEGEYVDDFNEWRDATSEDEAMDLFREDYSDPDTYDITIFNVE